jgi:hypothetical protein
VGAARVVRLAGDEAPEKQRGDAVTSQHERFAEELAERFETWHDPERHAELSEAFADRSAAGLAREFWRVEALLQGLEYTAGESLGLAASLAFGEARQIAEYARSACEQHAQ